MSKRIISFFLSAVLLFGVCGSGSAWASGDVTITISVSNSQGKDSTVTIQDNNLSCTDMGGTHRWMEATCTEPETCVRCGAVRGEALGHIWQPASGGSVVCARCGAQAEAGADLPLTMSPYSGTLSALNRLSFVRAAASSELRDQEYGYFPAALAIDNNTSTSWQEGVSGSGIGENLTLFFNRDTTVSVLQLYTGFTLSEYTYRANSRPKELLFEFSDGSRCGCVLADQLDYTVLALSKPVTTRYIAISIVDVYSADWLDTAISEVYAFNDGQEPLPVSMLEAPKTIYGAALIDGQSYSLKEKAHIIGETYRARKVDDVYQDGYSSMSNSWNETGYRLGFYLADGYIYYAEVIDNGTIIVKLYYWNGELFACNDYRIEGGGGLDYPGSSVFENVARQFACVYSIGLNSLS